MKAASPLPLAVRLLATVGIAFYAVAVPLLEVNASHVFNPAWGPHARIHEVWQLIANTSLGLFAAWRLWRRHDLRTATALNAIVMLSFLAAYALRDTYGGSMVVEGRGELRLVGLNIGVFGFGLALLCHGAALWLQRRRAN